MFIVSETLAGNDPKLLPEMVRYYTWWLYTVYEIPEGTAFNVADYDAEIVSENVAKSAKFANAKPQDGIWKIGLRTGTLAHEEVFMSSTEADGEKTYYTLTDEDQNNARDFMKSAMRVHVNKHFTKVLTEADKLKYGSKKNVLLAEIQNCNNMVDVKKLLHNKFGHEMHNYSEYGLSLPAKIDISTPGRDNY